AARHAPGADQLPQPVAQHNEPLPPPVVADPTRAHAHAPARHLQPPEPDEQALGTAPDPQHRTAHAGPRAGCAAADLSLRSCLPALQLAEPVLVLPDRSGRAL